MLETSGTNCRSPGLIHLQLHQVQIQTTHIRKSTIKELLQQRNHKNPNYQTNQNHPTKTTDASDQPYYIFYQQPMITVHHKNPQKTQNSAEPQPTNQKPKKPR